MYADRGGTPTSGPPFDHYEAKPGTMFSTADEILGKGKKVEGVSDSVVTAQRPAAAATHGFILPKLQDAPKPVRQKAEKVNQTTVFASGCVKYWGKGIQTFNTGVDKLNDEWDAAVADDFGLTKPTKPSTSGTPMAGDVRALDTYNTDLAAFDSQLSAKKAAKAKELRSRFTKLESKLDHKAQKIAGMLERGPDEKSILTLFGAGALPLMATTVFPDVDWTKANYRKALEEFGKTTEGIFLLTGDKKKVAEWIRKNPQFEQAVNWLLKTDGVRLTLLETRLISVQAYLDAQTLEAGMDGTDPQANLEKIRDATARLRLIRTTAEDGGRINEAAVTFIDSWTDEVGAKRLSELPDAVRANLASNGVPSVGIDSEAASYLSPVADAVMLRSNPDEVEAGVDLDTNNDGQVDKDDMSTAVQELVETRIRDGKELDTDAAGRFKGFVDLMDASTVDGGDEFTVDLAQSAITAKRDANVILSFDGSEDSLPKYDGKDPFGIDAAASDLLSVVGRNEDASAKVLLDTDLRRSVLGMNWVDGQGAADVIRGGTDRYDTDNDGGGTSLQAKAAYALIAEIASDREEYVDRIENETVSDAVVDTGITWIDAFAADPDDADGGEFGAHTSWTDVAGRKLPLGLTLSDLDRRSFLQFVSESGREDAVRFHAAGVNYAAQTIKWANEHGSDTSQRLAREAAGRLEGYINAADVEAAKDDEEARLRAKAAVATAAKVGVSSAATIGGVVQPELAPFLSVGAAVIDPVIDQTVAGNDADEWPEYKREMKIASNNSAVEILRLAGVPAAEIEAQKVTIKDLHEDYFDEAGQDNDRRNTNGWSSGERGREYLYGDGSHLRRAAARGTAPLSPYGP